MVRVGRQQPTQRRYVLTADSFAHRIGEPATDQRPPTLRGAAGWQKTAWNYYNNVGELHYAANYLGNGLSMARLYVAEINDEGVPVEVVKGEPGRVSRELLGGPGTAPRILHAYGVQRMVGGQSLLTVHDDHGWRIYPDTNFTVSTRGGVVSYKVNGQALPEGTLAVMLWTAHPGDINDVDSPVRAAHTILREIQNLDAYVYTTLLSRLATAGILKVPEGSSVPALEDVPEGVHPYMYMLQLAMETAIRDPNSAAARVPITIEVPQGEDIEHVSLDFPLTDSVDSKREAAIRRLAMSMDMPPEILTGMTGTNRSTAWQIDESSVKLHIEPALREISAALTSSYVQPLLDDKRYIVDYDISALQIRPDRTDAALALYDRGEIDGEALREETGLREYEAPEGENLITQMVKAALRANPGDVDRLAALVKSLGVDVPGEVITVPAQRPTPAQLEPAHTPTPATPEADIERPTPTTTAAAAGVSGEGERLAMLVAGAHMVVVNTLRTAGRRWVKAKSARHKQWNDHNPATIYLREQITADCLQPGETARDRADRYIGSLDNATAAAMLAGAEPDCVRECLREYIASLLLRQRPHKPDALRAVLAGCIDDA